jgi:CheY-like chemotaxis protein
VLGDPVQIHQVLMNLCVNSRDAMPQGGVLTLSVQQVVIDAASAQLHGVTAGNFSVLCVQDTGMGISADDLDRIYDPFFTTKPLGEGTGLGLSTVLGIVKSHLGFIQVESQLGKGTTFRILFPALESAPSPSVGVSSDVLPTGRGELILVVDDEELTRQMVQQVLAQHGYHVLLARNGTEALSQLDARPDLRLVLSDAMMSGMDGPTLLHHAKQRGVTAEFLIMTGLQSQPELQEVMSRYGVSLLEKPFSAATLLQSVQCVLQHRPYLSPSEE